MQDAQAIFQQTISRLPDAEKLRLATLILQDLTEGKSSTKAVSALDVLENLSASERVFNSSREVDEYLKTERESWDD